MARGHHGSEYAPFFCGIPLCTTCRPETVETEPPTFIAERTDRGWQFDCPCGKRHQHSAGEGHVVAHCHGLYRVGNDLVCPCGKRASQKWLGTRKEHLDHVAASDWHRKTGYYLA